MAVVPVTTRSRRAFPVRRILEHYTAAALTTAGNPKQEWIVPFDGRISDVIVTSQAAGTGGTSTIIDVNINGTTIYTTQANRPTLLLADSGMYAEAGEPQVTRVKAGDLISYDVDQITTTGPTRTNVTIVIEMP
jgi:hypothetical protein